MNEVFTPRCLYRKPIGDLLRLDPKWLIRKEGERYEKEIRKAAERIGASHGRLLVLLCGPSASGKTTTAHKLEQYLREGGREAYTVSLDNFYRGYGKAPLLPDGSYDYEAVEALDLPLLETCMQQLLAEGKTELPMFDFLAHSPRDERMPMCISEDAVVIFEGIHALNPLLRRHISDNRVISVFINVMSPICDGDGEVLSQRDLRLVRRLLRDVRFRNSSPENTLDMWRQVVRGEDLYLFPYVAQADIIFDTTHAYEAAMLGTELLPLLREVPPDSRYADKIQELIAALSVFEPLSTEYLPQTALLREFVG